MNGIEEEDENEDEEEVHRPVHARKRRPPKAFGVAAALHRSRPPAFGSLVNLDRRAALKKNPAMKPNLKLKAVTLIALMATLGAIHGADVTGKWKSEFDTRIGHLKYIYELKGDGEKVTGKALRELDGTKTTIELVEGKLKGDEVSFVEPLKVQEQEIRIEYKGKLAGDEIKLTRKVGDFATTEIVAKREKEAKEDDKKR